MTTNLETQKDLVDLNKLTQARLESVNPDDVRFSINTDKSEWWEKIRWKKWREKLEQTKERDRDYWNRLRELVAKINEEMPEINEEMPEKRIDLKKSLAELREKLEQTWWKKLRKKLEQTKKRDRDYWNRWRDVFKKGIDDATIEENTRKELLLNALKEGNPDELEDLLFSWLPEETPEQVQSIINWLESYLENQVKVKLAEAKNDPKLNYRIAVIEDEEKYVKEIISAYERIKVKMEA